jgi:predicted negative regulator of RcsB-dependent stress response
MYIFQKKNYFCTLKFYAMLENLSPQELKYQMKNNKNLRMMTYGVGAIVVLVLGYFAYKQFVWNPKNEESKDAYYEGLNYAAKDSTDKAIDALKPVVTKYDGKQGGELAQFVLARQYMAKGEFKKALEELEGVDVSDTYVSIFAIGLQGDCKSEMGNYSEAYDLYMEAADKLDNEKTTPEYLFKAALCAEQLKEFTNASDCYTRIKENYISFASQKSIDKYIARVANKTTK